MTSPCEYQHTKAALKGLEDLLECRICHIMLRDPCTLRSCQHIFCRECAEAYAGSRCPLCNIPSHMKDLNVNRNMKNIVKLTVYLNKLLYNEGQDQDGLSESELGSVSANEPAANDMNGDGSEHNTEMEVDNSGIGNEDVDMTAETTAPDDKDPPSVYDFISSPTVDTGSKDEKSRPGKRGGKAAAGKKIEPKGSRSTRSKTKQEKKVQRLQDINDTWAGDVTSSKCGSCKTKRGPRKMVRVVSPSSQEMTIEEVGDEDGIGDENRSHKKPKPIGAALASEVVANPSNGPERAALHVCLERIEESDLSLLAETGGHDHTPKEIVQRDKKTKKSRTSDEKTDPCLVPEVNSSPGYVELSESDDECLPTFVTTKKSGKRSSVTPQVAGSPGHVTKSGKRSSVTTEVANSPGHKTQPDESLTTPINTKKTGKRSSVTPQVVGSPGCKTTQDEDLTSPVTKKSGKRSSVIPQVAGSPGHKIPQEKSLTTPVTTKKSGKRSSVTPQVTSSPGQSVLLDESVITPVTTKKSRKRASGQKNLSALDSFVSEEKSAKKSHDEPVDDVKTPVSGRKGGRKSAGSEKTKPAVTPVRKTSRLSTSSPALRVDKRNKKGETPLQIAAIKGDLDSVQSLLKEGANPNSKDNAGWTPLHEAAGRGFTEIAKALLDNGAFIDAPGMDNDTPLLDAVQNYFLETVILLVSRGADPTLRNSKGQTPVDCAKDKEMRDALATTVIQTQSSAVPSTPSSSSNRSGRVVLLCTGLDRQQHSVVQKCATILHGRTVADFCPEVTHVITGVNENGLCQRTLKYLNAVLLGKWILNFEWIIQCIQLKERVCEEAFEVPGCTNHPDLATPLKGRQNAAKQLPRLFDGCQIYLSGSFRKTGKVKKEIIQLVKNGGATVLNREPKLENILPDEVTVPYHARSGTYVADCCYYIIHDPKEEIERQRHYRLCTAPTTWVMDCISQLELLDIPELDK